MEWISVKDRLPNEAGPEDDPADFSYLITDGKSISTGWYEPEYFAEDLEDILQYSSDMWHDDAHFIQEVTHWAPLPTLPSK